MAAHMTKIDDLWKAYDALEKIKEENPLLLVKTQLEILYMIKRKRQDETPHDNIIYLSNFKRI